MKMNHMTDFSKGPALGYIDIDINYIDVLVVSLGSPRD